MKAPHHRLRRPVGLLPIYLRASETSASLVTPPKAEFECDCAAIKLAFASVPSRGSRVTRACRP